LLLSWIITGPHFWSDAPARDLPDAALRSEGPVDWRTEVWRSQIAELELAQRSFEDTSCLDHDESLDRPVDRRSPGRPRYDGYGYDEHCANDHRDGAQWANDDRIKGGEAVMLPARRGRLRGLGGIAAARE